MDNRISEAPDLQKSIDEITATLKGHLSDFDRACLVADRKELRERLALSLKDGK